MFNFDPEVIYDITLETGRVIRGNFREDDATTPDGFTSIDIYTPNEQATQPWVYVATGRIVSIAVWLD